MELKGFFSFFVKNNYYNLFLGIAIVLYVITAVNSHGFYQGDAHYQIIEFANFKLGVNGVEDLPWEYHEQIRPTLQPILAFLFLKLFYFFQILDPYDVAFLFRLLSCGLYLLVVHFFIKQTSGEFTSKRHIKYYYFASFFLYFIPYLSTQFSSENWSGIFFVLGLAYYLSPTKKTFKPFLLGVILGVSFLFRFQIGLAILVFFVWLLLIKKESYVFLGKGIMGICGAIFLGIVLDCWFYQDFVITSWNYFYQNLVLDKASGFGVSPWDFYYHEIIKKSLYKLGAPIILACFTVIFIKPKNIFIWLVLSFVFFHSFIPHKELRFLFPVVSLLPIIFVYAVVWWCNLFEKFRWIDTVNQLLILGFGLVHFLLLVGYSQYNENGLINGVTKYIHEAYKGKQIQLNYYGNYYSEDFGDEDYLPMKFYFGDNIKFSKIETLDNITERLVQTEEVNLFLIDARSLNKEVEVGLKKLNYKLVKEGKPEWLLAINKLKNKGATTNSLLYALKKD